MVELTRWDQKFKTLRDDLVETSADLPGFHPADPQSIHDVPPGLENILNQILNRLMQFTDHRYINILNYHNIRDPRIHPVIAYLIDYMPPGIHLIITSQEQPALQIPRLRARRELLEIGPQDLDRSLK